MLENNIKLSIIINVYNQEELILKALDSLPKRKDIEIIVIDDGSTDLTYTNTVKWSETNKQFFGNVYVDKNEQNMGTGYTKQKAYDLASGEYLITLDSDDYVYTEEYSKAIDELYKDHPENEILILDYIENNGNITKSIATNATWKYFINLSWLRSTGIKFDTSLRWAEDWKLMAQLHKLNPIKTRLDILAYHYNCPREGSLSQLNQK